MGVNEAMELLLSLGHRRIGFISGPQALKSARIRSSAFLRSLGRYGIDEDKRLVGEGNRTMDGGLEAMARMLESHCSPTAVLASNDLTAIGMMRAARGLVSSGGHFDCGFRRHSLGRIHETAIDHGAVAAEGTGRTRLSRSITGCWRTAQGQARLQSGDPSGHSRGHLSSARGAPSYLNFALHSPALLVPGITWNARNSSGTPVDFSGQIARDRLP